MEITEGLISQYSSKLDHNEFSVGPDICCDSCSLFVLTETLQALLCPARCRQTADGAAELAAELVFQEEKPKPKPLHGKFSETPHLVRLGHFLGVVNAGVSLELIQNYVLSFDVH